MSLLESAPGEGRQHFVQVGDYDAPARLPDGGEETLHRDDLRRRQIREERLLDLPECCPFWLGRLEICAEHLPDEFTSLLSAPRLARCLTCELDEQRRHLHEAGGPAGGHLYPPEVRQQETSVAGPVLAADVDRDVVAPEPRTRGVANLPPAAGRVADDLRQQAGVVTIVVHLAKVRREHPGRLVPDLAGHTPLSCVTRPDVEDLVGQIPGC